MPQATALVVGMPVSVKKSNQHCWQRWALLPNLEALAIEAFQTVGVSIDSFYLYLLWTFSKQQDKH